MPPIDLNPKYHPMPEKPGSYSCPQCGHILAEIVSGKCQNCGHLFDQRQFRGAREELRSSRYSTTSRTPKEKSIRDLGKPFSMAPDTKVELICPQCKSNINDIDVINKKCPFCGYIGLMNSRQIDTSRQDPNKSQTATNLSPAESAIPEQLQQSHTSPVSEILPESDSSSLIDVAHKDWKQTKSDSKIDRTISRAKTIDKSKEWAEDATSKSSFTSSLQSVRDFAGNVNSELTHMRILRLTGTLLLAALIVFGIIRIIPMIFTSSPPSTEPSVSNIITDILIADVARNDITHSSATITWTTNKQTTGKVEYGTNTTYGIVEKIEIHADRHSIILKDLQPNTNYYYKITCTDIEGNEAVHEANQPFTTAMLPDTTPPAISAVIVTPSKISDRSAVISWTIDDEEAKSHIEYGKTEQYGKTKPADKDSSNVRTVILGGLEPSTTYQFRVMSEDTYGNIAEPYIGMPFTTHAPVPTGIKVGDRAPDFNLAYFTRDNLPQDYISGGNNVKLSDFRGKVVIVNFWSISCGACIAEMPEFEKVYQNSDSNELILLAIHTRQYRSRIERYFEKADWFLPVLLDTNGETSRDYKITRIPRTFFIDAEGIIQKEKLGRFNSASEIEAILERESLLGSKP